MPHFHWNQWISRAVCWSKNSPGTLNLKVVVMMSPSMFVCISWSENDFRIEVTEQKLRSVRTETPLYLPSPNCLMRGDTSMTLKPNQTLAADKWLPQFDLNHLSACRIVITIQTHVHKDWSTPYLNAVQFWKGRVKVKMKPPFMFGQ